MKRLDGKSAGIGIAAAFLLWGLFNGGFDGGDAPALDESATPPPDGYMGGLEDTPIAPPPEPLPMPEPAPQPAPAPAPVQQPVAAPGAVGSGSSLVGTGLGDGGPLGTGTSSQGKGILEWFGKLSPGAQQTLAQGVAGGAAGLMSALAQRNAQKDAEDQRDEAKEDKRRRSAIPDVSAGFIGRTREA
jgi:hypothetical protein